MYNIQGFVDIANEVEVRYFYSNLSGNHEVYTVADNLLINLRFK